MFRQICEAVQRGSNLRYRPANVLYHRMLPLTSVIACSGGYVLLIAVALFVDREKCRQRIGSHVSDSEKNMIL
jgi:hypothetical protein